MENGSLSLKYVESAVTECMAKIGAFAGSEHEQDNIRVWVADWRKRIMDYGGFREEEKRAA
jgi:hypothetical protein